MNEQHRKVRTWLKELFQDEQIPTYEISEESLSILEELCDWNSENGCRDSKLKREILNRQIDEYRSETKRMNRILFRITDATSTSSTMATTAFVNVLTDISEQLGVDEPTETDLILALNDLTIETSLIPVRNFEHSRIEDESDRQRVEALVSLELNRKALSIVTKECENAAQIAKSCSRKSYFFADKKTEYTEKGERFKKALKKNLTSKELTHEYLKAMKDELEGLKADLKPLKSKLESFHELPPSLELAFVRLAEAKMELDGLTHQLTKEISDLHI